MRKLMLNYNLWVCSVFLILISSCISSQSFMPVKGIGDLVEKSFNISGFHGVDVSGGFDVTLVQGASEGVVISAQNNLYDYIHVEVVQGVLKVYTDGNIMSTRSLKARVSYKSISELKVSGGGDMVSENTIDVPELTVQISGGGDLTSNIKSNELKCRISGGGDAILDGKTNVYNIEMSGGGDLESNMDASSLSCRLSGGGDLTLRCTEAVKDAVIDVSGGGDVDAGMNAASIQCLVSGGGNSRLSGHASGLKISVSGGGDVDAGDLTAEEAYIQAGGGSDVHVNAVKELKGIISGGGDIYYSGTPEIIAIDAKGGSEIHRE